MEHLAVECGAPRIDLDAVEIVERKGLGHPDSICDALMDRVSQALCAEYLQSYGQVLHHNCDKGLLVAGRAEPRFGGGRVAEPMRLVIAGRATKSRGSVAFPVHEIAEATARAWFAEHIPTIHPIDDVVYQVELAHGSPQLTSLWERQGERLDQGRPSPLVESMLLLGANDTSVGVGYAPLSETERLVLEAEHFLNAPAFKQAQPACGYDVKVLAVRRGRAVDMTVAVPLIDSHVSGEASYFEEREAIGRALQAHLEGHLSRVDSLSLRVNALDRPGAGAGGVYLSVLGTSAEGADSGAVGRGNAVNGVIAPCRPRGAEAAAGKNPVSHIGKIYNVLTHRIAKALHREVDAIEQATVWLVGSIGDPVDRPRLGLCRVASHPDASPADVEQAARALVARELGQLPRLIGELIRGEHPMC